MRIVEKQKIEEIIKQVAEANGVSVEEVRREIKNALAQSTLSQTPEEAVAHLAKVTKERIGADKRPPPF